MNGIRIRGGRIIDPVRGRDGVGELLVWDGRIVPALPASAAVVTPPAKHTASAGTPEGSSG